MGKIFYRKHWCEFVKMDVTNFTFYILDSRNDFKQWVKLKNAYWLGVLENDKLNLMNADEAAAEIAILKERIKKNG